jgi:ABC-type glucose/galactose transport system permease subunit
MTRALELEGELLHSIRSYNKAATKWRRFSLVLMLLALLCSEAASIAGLGFAKPHLAGTLALLPPIIAFMGVNLKVYEKATVAPPDVFDEKVGEQGGFSHARHPLDIDVLR